MKKIFEYVALFGLLVCSGCNSWLNVNPKSQIKESALFESEGGFRDALVGIYAIMARTDGYGGNETMGILDVFAQNYSDVATEFDNALKYDYNSTNVETRLNSIWQINYKAIVNCNYILKNIERKKGIFRKGVYEMVKGETMALRAFLHFDLLRGFATSYAVGANQPAIPYVDVVTNKPVVQLTVKEILERIIIEVDSARNLIRNIDPIGPAFESYSESSYNDDDFVLDDGFWLYRKSRLNYYGMTALLARMYMYKDDKTKALSCALEVINSGKFILLTEEMIKDMSLTITDHSSRNEYISSLYVYKLREGCSDIYFKEKATISLYIADTRRMDVFGMPGVDIDWRNQNLFVILEGESKEFLAKYRSGNLIPLFKLSEMYLIAAESSGDLNYLHELRDHRGYINFRLEKDCDLQKEIQNEYRKEFLAEGQLFYYYKRLNMNSIPYTVTDMSSVYVFPMPDDELEFGDIQ